MLQSDCGVVFVVFVVFANVMLLELGEALVVVMGALHGVGSDVVLEAVNIAESLDAMSAAPKYGLRGALSYTLILCCLFTAMEPQTAAATMANNRAIMSAMSVRIHACRVPPLLFFRGACSLVETSPEVCS